jgi:fumarylacetoacetase
MPLDFTHDPARRSWLESANNAGGDFPIQNLPFGVFRRQGSDEPFRGGVAIGDQIVDLGGLADSGLLSADVAHTAGAGRATELNGLMACGAAANLALRQQLSELLLAGNSAASQLAMLFVSQSGAEFAVPARIGDYTDFYTSIYHATAIGRLLRPDNPLLPNYKWIPIGYHGRSSSIGVSGQRVIHPSGQTLPKGATNPVFGPSRRLDYELELGAFVGAGNALGERIALAEAEEHLFGICLLNDWSARDIQAWEYQPLGPLLSKNFATTVSPWVVTLDALAPFRAPWARPATDPAPLSYLVDAGNAVSGAIDVQLEALLQSAAMRAQNQAPQRLSQTSYRHAYWTLGQLLTHHTVNGCNLRSGDLLATGTQSGPSPGEAGSLMELSVGGTQPLTLSSGETRAYLEDGDTIILRGWCEKPGAARIGLGEVRGQICAAAA